MDETFAMSNEANSRSGALLARDQISSVKVTDGEENEHFTSSLPFLFIGMMAEVYFISAHVRSNSIS